MGWERKRGKIEEFNRLLRGASDTSFTVQVGERAILPSVRYCITLDTDTRLPRDAAKTLIGIIAHPLNRPRFDARLGRVMEGYGILQPRVSVTMASAAGSRFARTYAGHTGVDPYTTAVSDVYQDLFDEGIFTGKGLYDVDAFRAALERARAGERPAVARSVRGPVRADGPRLRRGGGGRLSVERARPRAPPAPLGARRLADPVVAAAVRAVADRACERNRLPLISRWKILDNLRRSLVAPATVSALLFGWTVLPGAPIAWTAIALAAGRAANRAAPAPARRRPGASGAGTVVPPRDDRRSQHRSRPRRAAAGAARQPGLRAAARDHRHAGAPRDHEAPAARVGDRGRQRPAGRRAAPPRVRQGDDRQSARRARRPGARPRRPSGRAGCVGADSRLVGRGAARSRTRSAVRCRRAARRSVRRIARSSRRWRARRGGTSTTFAGPEDHALPPDNVQMVAEADRRAPDLAHQHRDGAARDARGPRLRIHRHRGAGRANRRHAHDRRSLERFEGHLLNWYDTRTLAPLPPAYVSTVDSGNLAGALLTLSVALQQLHLDELAARAVALFDGMNFRFLYDPQRQLFAIGYRLADAEGPGRHDASYYDLLASEARLASFLAIAKGDVPESHWFHLGRSVTSVRGAPVLLSWSATMFEYLMPLLVMRSYPDTLLDESCRIVVRRQIDYAAARGVPWGISESAYDVVDRHDTFQYKAFGVPGLGLKRGLGDELVVAPYATALAAMIEPEEATANLRRLAAAGLDGDYGFFDAIDYTNREGEAAAHDAAAAAGPSGAVVRTYLAHHEGMTLVALANALFERSHGGALSRRPAGAGDRAAAAGARPAPFAHDPAAAARRDARRRAAAGPARAAVSNAAHAVSPRAVPVQRQLRDDRDQRRRGRELLPRPRGDEIAPRPDARSGQPVRLSARRAERGRVVGDLSSDRAGTRRSTSSPSARTGRRSAGATTGSSRSSTSPCRPKTTSRSAG